MAKYLTLSLAILSLCILAWGCEHRTRCYDDRQPMAGLGLSFCEPKTYYSKPDDSDRYYTPQPIHIKPGMIHAPNFTISRTLTIVNAQMDTEWYPLGIFSHHWFGNLRRWTDTAIGVTTNELKKRHVTVKDDLPLLLKLSVTSDQDGSLLVGVVSRECPFDPVQKRELALDTDQDGVPDYLDQCPDTPQGAHVNHRGCPVDTDHDSLPDYRDHCPRTPQGFKIDNMPPAQTHAGIPEHPEHARTWVSETYLVSSLPADRVMGLLKRELEKKSMGLERDTPGILSFHATVPEWTKKFSAIKTALGKQGIQITNRMPRILQLAITDVSLTWDTREIGCRLNLRVVTGEGDILDFHDTNYAIDLNNSCDGAVTKEVAAMFNNARIRAYLAAPVEPRDSDCDGVPDDMDECPDTPLGVKVDDRGCPLDTDGDGVPDYLDEFPSTPRGVDVDSKGCPLDSDGDRVPDYLDECPDTPKGVKVDNRGCPLDSDGDGVINEQDKCPGTPKGARVDSEGCWVIDEAFFDFDKSEIKPLFYPVFDQVVAVLNNNPTLKIRIEGYTDNIGTEAYNQKLSKARADAVKKYLIKKGINSDRLSTVGYGFSHPKATNKTNAGRAMNRRVKLEPLSQNNLGQNN